MVDLKTVITFSDEVKFTLSHSKYRPFNPPPIDTVYLEKAVIWRHHSIREQSLRYTAEIYR